MDWSRQTFSAIFYNFWVGLILRNVSIDLSAFDNQSSFNVSVYDWYNELKRGRHSLKEAPCKTRQISAATAENIDAVQNVGDKDRHITYQGTQSELDTS